MPSRGALTLPAGRPIRYLCTVPVQRPEGWCVYLLRCGDGSLYCGVTNDLDARLAAHRSGRGARYTRGRGPLRLVWCEPSEGKGPALRREHAIKRLSVAGKRALLRSARKATPKAAPA